MSVEALVAIIIAVLSGLGHFIDKSQLKKCDCFCVHSDCRKDNEKTIEYLEAKINRNAEKLAKIKSKSSSTPSTPIRVSCNEYSDIISTEL
jgi:hypothetical protein